MSDKQFEEEVREYISTTRFAILSYVREDRVPVPRSMCSFVPDGLDIYFSTPKVTAKVKEIGINKRVSFFFEHDNQALDSWKSVLLIGEAEQVEQEPELSKAVGLLSGRNPRFKERVAKGELPNTAIFKIRTREVEYLDYSKGPGFVQKFKL